MTTNPLAKIVSAVAMMSGITLLTSANVQAANFTAGNVAVFQADSASANNTTFSILEINGSTAGQVAPVQTISINGTSGPDALRTSGSAGTTGYLADSDDRTLLVFGAHNSTTTSGNANAILPRAVGVLNNAGTFNKPAAYTGVSGQQVRGATTIDNALFYIGDQTGIYTNGSAPLFSANCRSIKSYGGTVYLLQQSASITSISAVSASGTSVTGLPGLTGDNAASDFCLLSSGTNGASYDLLYILDESSATVGAIRKFSLVGGTWATNGIYTTTFGGFGLAGATNANGATLYVTSGNGGTAANKLMQLTDTVGYNALLSINSASNVTLYTAAAGTTMKGVALAPIASCSPPATPTAMNDGPALIGGTINLSTPTIAGAIYNWTGPNGFFSTSQNPVISNITAAAAGPYLVTATLGTCSSAPGQTTVVVFTPPTVSVSPASLWAYTNQTANFTTSVTGTPAPTYQWNFNGTDLPGETNSTLAVALTSTNQSGLYSVIVSNMVDVATNSAALTVTFKPDIRITEVMASQNTNELNGITDNHGDWFELSNLGDFAVNLRNFRMDDSSAALATSVLITNDATIAPGESVICIEVTGTNTPDTQISDFRTWWGLSNSVPQVLTYGGANVGLSATSDGVTIWNAAATNDTDTLDAVTIGASTRGVSFTADANGLNFGDGTLSVVGVNGAYASPIGGDIGSPGILTVTVTPPNPSQLTVTTFSPPINSFSFSTQTGYHYAVQYNVDLTTTNWITLTNITAGGTSQIFTDGTATNSASFYRVVATP